MKMKKYVSLLLCALLLMGLFTGCGSGSKAMTSAASYDMAVAEEAPAARNAAGGTLTDSGASGSTALPQSRKWIVTVYLSAETEDLDALTAALDETIAALNGYVEDQSVYNGSTYSNRRYRNASLTVRIPAEDVDQFTQQVAGIANVVSKETNRQDVTLSYVATESRMTALQTEETRLLELMAQAEKMALRIAGNAPIAVRACKKAINEGLEKGMDDALVLEEGLFGSCFETHDQVEGMGCFMSREKPKPKPVFTNN